VRLLVVEFQRSAECFGVLNGNQILFVLGIIVRELSEGVDGILVPAAEAHEGASDGHGDHDGEEDGGNTAEDDGKELTTLKLVSTSGLGGFKRCFPLVIADIVIANKSVTRGHATAE